MITIVTLVLWILAGAIVLSKRRVTKLDYILVWVTLLIQILGRVYGK